MVKEFLDEALSRLRGRVGRGLFFSLDMPTRKAPQEHSTLRTGIEAGAETT
jgi:hypothetical protein